jgi:hypothetical protein
MRMAAFDHVRRLGEVHDHLTATELKPRFIFDGARIPLINPQGGIYNPQRMQFLLSIKTVFPKSGVKVWYDDQREVHRQIYEIDETIDYAFMGQCRRFDPGRFRSPSISSKSAESSRITYLIKSVPYKCCTKFTQSGGLEKNGRRERILGLRCGFAVRRFMCEGPCLLEILRA